MEPKRRSAIEREVDQEIIAEGPGAVSFDLSRVVHVPATRPPSKLISIRLPMDMIDQLRSIAADTGDLGYQQLIKIMLAKALAESGHFQFSPGKGAAIVPSRAANNIGNQYAIIFACLSGNGTEPPTNTLEPVSGWKQDVLLRVVGATGIFAEALRDEGAQ